MLKSFPIDSFNWLDLAKFNLNKHDLRNRISQVDIRHPK